MEDDYVLVAGGMAKSPYIAALDRETGQRAWTVKREAWTGIHGEHRTPLVIPHGNRTILLDWSLSSNELTAYDARTGGQLWTHELGERFGGEAVASILSDGDVLYLSGTSRFVALALPSDAAGGTPRLVWETNLRKRGPSTASPVLWQGRLFMVSNHGHVSCLDASTGELLWQEKLRGTYYASPVVVANRVFFWNTAGVTTVVDCQPEFTKVAENTLPGGIYASPAPVGNRLIVRTTEALWCIERQHSNSNPPREEQSGLTAR